MTEFPTDAFQHQLQARSTAEIVIEAAIMILITAAASCGNLMVCWAVFRNKRLRTIPNIYVVVLAISDILMATICMPLSVEVVILSKWTKSFNVCQFQGFFSFFLAFTSLQTMTAMAINRYYRVVKPEKYGRYFTAKRTIASVVIVIASASVGAGLQLVFKWATFTVHYGKVICFPLYKTPMHEMGYIAFVDVCYIGFPVLVITVCYIKIFRAVKAHKKSLFKARKKRTGQQDDVGETSASGTQNQQRIPPKLQINVEEIKITKILFVTVLGFIICWTPLAIIDMINAYSSRTFAFPRFIFLVWIYLGYGSSSINPFIYGILNRSFRKEFLRIFRFRCGNEIQPPTMINMNSVLPIPTGIEQDGTTGK